jgi:RNA polymerase sigma-70 factor (ECF subfamily)
MRQRTNAEWLAVLREGGAQEAAALAELRQALFDAIRAFLSKSQEGRSMHADDLRQMAEDCAQESVLAVREKLHAFRGESRFSTWAYSIAIRMALGELRRRRWRREAVAEAHLGQSLPSWPIEEPGPERSLEQKQAWATLSRLIESALTPLQKRALIAHAFQGMPLDDVAAWMGTNRNSLYKLIHDARKRLKQALVAEGIAREDLVATFDRPGQQPQYSSGGKNSSLQRLS